MTGAHRHHRDITATTRRATATDTANVFANRPVLRG
jgi:hypothetical protein